jgi:hypothetical protein
LPLNFDPELDEDNTCSMPFEQENPSQVIKPRDFRHLRIELFGRVMDMELCDWKVRRGSNCIEITIGVWDARDIVGDKVGSATIFLGTIAEAVGYGASWASCGYFFEVNHLP